MGVWSEAIFPGDRTRETLLHLREEITELLEADAQSANYGEEAADVLILLLCYAHRKGFLLADALARKHVMNLERSWALGPDGMSRHV